MIDAKLLRQSLQDVADNLARRGFAFDTKAYQALEDRRKELQVATEKLQSERNTSAKNIGTAKAQGEDVEPLLAAVQNLGNELDEAESSLANILSQLQDIELGLPNLLLDDVPDGADEASNLEIRQWGTPAEFDFDVKDHIDLGEALGMLDFDSFQSSSRCALPTNVCIESNSGNN